MTSSIIALSITILFHYGECHYGECHYTECHYAECRVLFAIMLNVFMLTVIMLSVIMLTVVAPCQGQQVGKSFYNVAPSSSFTIVRELSSLAAMF